MACSADDGRQSRRRRSFAVGAGDENTLESAFGIAQFGEQHAHVLQIELVRGSTQFVAELVQLRNGVFVGQGESRALWTCDATKIKSQTKRAASTALSDPNRRNALFRYLLAVDDVAVVVKVKVASAGTTASFFPV